VLKISISKDAEPLQLPTNLQPRDGSMATK